MNRPIRNAVGFIGLLFIALLANMTISYVVRTPDLNADARNRRVRDAEFATNRGDIMVGTTAIASTEKVEGRFGYRRVYTDGPMYAPITGYYSYNYGVSGLEHAYSAELSGTADSQAFSRIGDLLANRQPEGADIHTTINPKAQKAAWDGLGSRKGAVVAIDYKTGAILVMVSTPSYDPALLSNTDLQAAADAWVKLNEDPNRPMANRAAREIYPPGSTFKLVTAAAGLKSGLHRDSKLDSPSQMTLPNSSHVLGNQIACGSDHATLEHSLAISCNTAFANLGLSLGADDLRNQAQAFGFDSQLKSDVYAATSRFPADPDQPQLALSSIGQFDVAASPLQMAMVVAGIANDGVLMEPYLVQEIRNPDLTLLSSHRPRKMSDAMDSAHAQELKAMMVSVVTNGTGRKAAISGVTIGGKTGTAETTKDRAPYAWFVGFAENPNVAIAVFIEDAGVARTEISGGGLCAPIFRDVVEALR